VLTDRQPARKGDQSIVIEINLAMNYPAASRWVIFIVLSQTSIVRAHGWALLV
jgi:hypothetical protein